MQPPSIVHLEVASRDAAATKRFYARVFGWEIEEKPELEFALAKALEGPTFGFRGLRPGESPMTVSFVGVPDIDKTLASARASGGKVLIPKGELPGMGFFALLEAPGGVWQGVWQDAP